MTKIFKIMIIALSALQLHACNLITQAPEEEPQSAVKYYSLVSADGKVLPALVYTESVIPPEGEPWELTLEVHEILESSTAPLILNQDGNYIHEYLILGYSDGQLISRNNVKDSGTYTEADGVITFSTSIQNFSYSGVRSETGIIITLPLIQQTGNSAVTTLEYSEQI